jgi:hypothetical protein
MAKTPKRRTPPMTINRKKRDKNSGAIDRLHRTRQIKKLTKKLARTSDYLERFKIEAEIEGLRWKSKNSGEKLTH